MKKATRASVTPGKAIFVLTVIFSLSKVSSGTAWADDHDHWHGHDRGGREWHRHDHGRWHGDDGYPYAVYAPPVVVEPPPPAYYGPEPGLNIVVPLHIH